MRITNLMSGEGKIHDNADLSNNEEEILPTEPETKPMSSTGT